MQSFSQANTEVLGTFHIWYFLGREVDAFRTQQAAEAAVHRALHTGWSNDYLLDADGSFLFLGLQSGHSIISETRDHSTGLEIK